jgi:GTP cyclohydrolase I
MKDSPDIAEVEAAVRTLLRWAGDDPAREGLVDTPNRVARAYREFFWGYPQDPQAVLSATFEEAGDYDDMVLVRNIRFESAPRRLVWNTTFTIGARSRSMWFPTGRH